MREAGKTVTDLVEVTGTPGVYTQRGTDGDPPLIDMPGYQGPERRMDHVLWRHQVDQRLDHGAEKMRGLQASVEENTALTKTIEANTSEMVSLFKSLQGAFNVFNLIGKAAKPLAYIAMAVTSLWGLVAMIKGGDVPNVPHGPK